MISKKKIEKITDTVIEENKKQTETLKKNVENISHVINNQLNEKSEEIINNVLDPITKQFMNIKEEMKKLEEKIIEVQNKSFQLELTVSKLNKLNYVNPEYLSLYNQKTDKKKVLLLGFYGGYNLGDELMLQTLINKFRKHDNIELTVMLANNQDYDIFKYKNIKFIHYPQTNYDFEILTDIYDCFVYGGGALLDDTQYKIVYSNEISLSTTIIELSSKAIEKNKETYFIGLSCNNTFNNQEYLLKLSDIINRATYFSLRDKISLEVLKNYNININNIKIIDDIVLSNIISPIKNKKENEYENFGIVLIENDEHAKEYNLIFLKILLKILNGKKLKYKINLIPFYDYNNFDIKYYQSIKEKINCKNINIEKYVNTLEEITEMLSDQDYIISMRYHCSLISQFMNKKTLTIINDFNPHYKNKMNYMFEEYKFKKNSLNVSEKNEAKITEAINQLLNEKINKIDRNQVIKNNRDKLETIINNICS